MSRAAAQQRELSSASSPARRWEYNNDGSISGRVYGKKGFREGENMSTSIVPKENRFGHYVVTTSGTYYKLGEKLVRQMEVKKPRRGIRDRVVEEAKLEGAEELWCGARFGKERGAAVLARQRMSGEGLPEAGPASKDPAAAKQADRLSASGSGSINQLDERSSPRDRKRPAAQPTPAEEAPKKKQPVRLPLEPATTTALAWLASTASPLLSSRGRTSTRSSRSTPTRRSHRRSRRAAHPPRRRVQRGRLLALRWGRRRRGRSRATPTSTRTASPTSTPSS